MSRPASRESAEGDGDSAVIVGVAGFVGRQLAAYLSSLGLCVYGVDRISPADAILGLAGLVELDILEEGALAAHLAVVNPQYVFHLAAERSAEPLSGVVGVNAVMAMDVLRSALHLRSLKAVVVTGSASEYGSVDPSWGLVTEETPLAPVSLYGVSKAAEWHTVRWLAGLWRLPVAYSRTFNLTGPGEPSTLVCGALSRRLAEVVRKGGDGALVVHSADHVRDFVDVRDAVRAYWLIAQVAGSHCPVFNVCSGRGATIGEVAQILVSAAGSSAGIQQVASAGPTSDAPWQVGSHAALTAATGWEPTVALEDSLAELYLEQLGPSDAD